MRETAPKLGVGFTQCLLRIHLEESREVDHDEQQVTQLIFDRGEIAAGTRRVEFRELFMQLIHDLSVVLPIESEDVETEVEFTVTRHVFSPEEQAEFDAWEKLSDEAWAMIDGWESEEREHPAGSDVHPTPGKNRPACGT